MTTSTDFDAMSWHDNAVHAIRIVESEGGVGELVLDIDFIVEWLPPDNGAFAFRIAPSDLVFHEVSKLVVSINYAAMPAAVQPMIIHEIQREPVRYANGHGSFVWRIEGSWPPNALLTFEASGFTQTVRSPPKVSGAQYLPASERAA